MKREAVVQVVAVANDVGRRNAEETRFHPHRTAQGVAAEADYEIRFKASQKLRVVHKEFAGLVRSDLTPRGAFEAGEEVMPNRVIWIGRRVDVDQDGLRLVLIKLCLEVGYASFPGRIVKNTAAYACNLESHSGQRLQHCVALHGGAVRHVKQCLRASEEDPYLSHREG